MQILEINKFYYPWVGGVETIVKDIAEDLNGSDGLTVDVLACQVKGARDEETINGIKVYRAASWGKSLGMPLSLDFFRWLREIENDYDALLFHFPFPLAALAIPFLQNKNVFILYHSDIVRQKISRLFFLPFINASLDKAKKIIISSRRLLAHSPALSERQEKCAIIPFGVDINHFRLTEEIKEQAENIKQQYSSPLLLSVGRLVYYKGYKYLIAAIKNVNAHLLIIGSGPQEEDLKTLIKIYKLENKISLIKFVDDLRPYYAACDIFILPSIADSEAFGLVQIEAMAYAKPVINTNLKTGAAEVSLDGLSGLTVAPRNPAALTAAINRILSDPELKNRLGKAARLRVETIFNRKIFNGLLRRIF